MVSLSERAFNEAFKDKLNEFPVEWKPEVLRAIEIAVEESSRELMDQCTRLTVDDSAKQDVRELFKEEIEKAKIEARTEILEKIRKLLGE